MWCNFVLLSFLLATVSAASNIFLCYYGSWAVYRSGNGQFSADAIDASVCTHVVYAFAGINIDGTVRHTDSWNDINLGSFDKFINLKTENTNLKTLIAIGGWNEGSTNFSTVVSSSSLRTTFVNSVVSFLQEYGFDGLSLDWEYPCLRGGASTDKDNLSALLAEFRTAFDSYGYILTVAAAAVQSSVDTSYDVPELSKYCDFINVMTYDLHGSWDGVTGQNSPLYASSIDTTDYQKTLNVDDSIQGWISRGADPAKIVVGIPLYGRTYTLADTSSNGLGATTTGAGTAGPYTLESGYLGYNEICEKLAAGGWTVVWDDEQKTPYAYNGDQWIGYDNPTSVAVKVSYAKSLGLGGVMVWSVETDDFKGTCGTVNPILNAIKDSLESSSSDSSSATSSTSTTTSTTTTTTTISAATTTTTASATATTSATTIDSSTDNNESVCVAEGYVRDSSDCSVFYYCISSGSTFIVVTFQCSSGLYFDKTLNVCNYISSVDC